MYKLGFLLLAMLALASAKPAVVSAPVAYTGLPVAAPVAFSAPLVTATSSQFVARNYNGFVAAAPYVAAPLVASSAPLVASSAYSYAPAFVY